MNLSPGYLIKLLEKNGFIFKRAKGSHRIYFNPANGTTVVVPVHGNRDLRKGTFFTILRQAGIDDKSL
jgi:predicted RNA binding protein YcfA (HicA-like mRNA interferase family)